MKKLTKMFWAVMIVLGLLSVSLPTAPVEQSDSQQVAVNWNSRRGSK
jgi:hypothetical protein